MVKALCASGVSRNAGAGKAGDLLVAAGLALTDLVDVPESDLVFPDGGRYRFEIATVDGPEAFGSLIDQASMLGVPVHRASQGSGGLMLSDAELEEIARLQRESRVAYLPFVGPRSGWDVRVPAGSTSGRAVAGALRGSDQFCAAMHDVVRMADAGLAGALVADWGLLAVLGRMRRAGDLPPDFALKTSIFLAVSNASTARLAEDLGATSINVPIDLTLPQLAAIRAAVDTPIDVYVESPDDLGGVVRYSEMADFVRALSPVVLKFGLRRSPWIHPSGRHLRSLALASTAERVRQAGLALDTLRRSAPSFAGTASPLPSVAPH